MSNNKSDSENDDMSGPRPRLCHLRKWAHFQGYGFNLHAEKTRNGQSIGKVDPNSPAESAGLKEKDRIIEVNYVNISNENHQQVVKRIRCGLEINGQLSENEVVLLVVDPEADEYYKKRNIVIKHDFKNVLRLETPPETELNNDKLTTLPPPESSPQVSSHRNSISSTSEHNNSTEINNNNFDKKSNDYRYNTNTSQNSEKVSTPLIQDKSLNYEKVSPPQTPLSTKSNGSVSSSNKDTQSNKSSTTNTMNNNNMNNNNNHSNSNSSSSNNNNANPFAMSAAEYKEFLKKNKTKSDPRNVHVDIKQKYQIFQNM